MSFQRAFVRCSHQNTQAPVARPASAILLALFLAIPLSGYATENTATRFAPCASAVPPGPGVSAAIAGLYKSPECQAWRQWKSWESSTKSENPPLAPVPVAPADLNMPFTAPKNSAAEQQGSSGLSGLLMHMLNFLVSEAHALTPVAVDGNLDDWNLTDQLNIPQDRPPYLGSGDLFYGRFENTPAPQYVLALKAASGTVGPNSTIWLNTDQNSGTGYQLWGSYAGAEYFVNVYADGTPHLYDQNFQWIGGPLQHAYSADGSTLEVVIPAAMIGISTLPSSVNVLADINDTVFVHPEDFWFGGQYTLAGTPRELPPRTDQRKRVGIVFSSTTRDMFFQDKAYSQLYMSLQNQATMAGLPFDLLTEQDLTDINNIVNYDALMFPYFMFVGDDIRDSVRDTLFYAVYHYGIGIITADNLLSSDQNGNAWPGDSYATMKQLLGITRVDGEGPVEIQVEAADVTHPAMSGYTAGENIINYAHNWYSRYEPVAGQGVSVLADQLVTGSMPGRYPMVVATHTGGRNVHFSSTEVMADTNMTWQAVQWAVWGDQPPVGIKLTRSDALMLSRNDMDQSQEVDETDLVLKPLIKLLRNWNRDYEFVGSFYINIGNDPDAGQYTNWKESAPLYRNMVRMGNEIGTHSWTHPHDTDILTAEQIEYEFNQSMNLILSQIRYTWERQQVRGGAVPGAPESRATAEEIMKYLDYLSGGYSGTGAGYPNAFGYMTPDSDKIYFSPNMLFDFTLIQWGIPVGYPPVPVPLTAAEAELWWQGEMDRITRHASTALIHWPWHDYGPTTSSDPVTGDGYTVSMYENTIKYAANQIGAEFVTLADADQRLRAFPALTLDAAASGATVNASVGGGKETGQMALEVYPDAGQTISSVGGWYAWNGNKVFLPEGGGYFSVQLGTVAQDVSRIIKMPMRSSLISVSGDGRSLDVTLDGKGTMIIQTAGPANNYELKEVEGEVRQIGTNLLEATFKKDTVQRVILEEKR